MWCRCKVARRRVENFTFQSHMCEIFRTLLLFTSSKSSLREFSVPESRDSIFGPMAVHDVKRGEVGNFRANQMKRSRLHISILPEFRKR